MIFISTASGIWGIEPPGVVVCGRGTLSYASGLFTIQYIMLCAPLVEYSIQCTKSAKWLLSSPSELKRVGMIGSVVLERGPNSRSDLEVRKAVACTSRRVNR